MKLKVEPLTLKAFSPYGDVIETEGALHYPVNQGTAERFHDLARIDVGSENGQPGLSIFIAQPRPRPIMLKMMERHPLGTQAFVPLQNRDYLVVVGSSPEPSRLRVFRASGLQGVNYHRNVWHHPLLVLERDSRFLVIDRIGEGANLEETMLVEAVWIGE
jgi:ureidoglycolate lyase